MIEVLFALHVVILVGLYNLIKAKVGRVIALVYFGYTSAFTVLKPALLYYADLYFPYSTNEPDAVQRLLIGSFIFLLVQWIGIKLLADSKPSRFALRSYSFDGARPRGIALAFGVLMVISFIGCTIKFGSPAYLFTANDSFEATMKLADGSWYITYLAEILMYGLLMAVGYLYWKRTAWRSLLVTLGLMLLTYFWVKSTARTGMLVVLIAWISCFFSEKQQRRINIFYLGGIGYVLLILLYVGNFVRLGAASDIDLSKALFGALFAAAADLSPIDNAVLLYAEMGQHAGTYFMQLLGAITPLVLLPSSIFPFKLPADKDAELTRIFFPQGADTAFYHEGSTLTFTVPASGYADAGYFGLLVAAVLYVLLFCWYIRIFRCGSKSSRFIAAFQMLVHIVGYRLSIETLLISFYTSLFFFWFIKRVAFSLGRVRPIVPRGVQSTLKPLS